MDEPFDTFTPDEDAWQFCGIARQLQGDDLSADQRKRLLGQLDALADRSAALRLICSDTLLIAMQDEQLQSGSQLLSEARASFPGYYARATDDDVMSMDALVLAWIVLTHGINCPRAGLPASSRRRFEESCDKVERHFLKVRDHVRESPAFRQLPAREQMLIAGVLFVPQFQDD